MNDHPESSQDATPADNTEQNPTPADANAELENTPQSDSNDHTSSPDHDATSTSIEGEPVVESEVATAESDEIGDEADGATPEEIAAAMETSQPFVGRWNCLVSTTNWEKGRIIFEWRDALEASGAPASEYADETWARHVGSVSGQHVGRLRRVSMRFSRNYQEFEGLFWSHFQASLDWEDAEMWLEGAVQNGWSVANMRNSRWETMGSLEENRPADEDVVVSETDEDFEPSRTSDPTVNSYESSGEVATGPAPEGPDFGDESEPSGSEKGDGASIYADDPPGETVEFVRPFESLGELPADVVDAFEAYKLVILRHKGEGWESISREEMLSSLDALKELALAPSAE